MHLKRSILSVSAALCFVLAQAFAGFSDIIPELDLHQPPGRLVPVDGVNLHIYCIGNGGPVVLIDTGLGQHALNWLPLQLKLAAMTRTCTYDRPGYGWSEWNFQPRQSDMIARELELLLKSSGEKGPFLLIGHSFGGFNLRHFAARNPGIVSALILVEASHERQFQLLESVSGDTLSPTRSPFILHPGRSSAGLPDAVRKIIDRLDRQRKVHAAVRAELAMFRQNAASMHSLPVRFEFPVAVISRGRSPWKDDTAGRAKEDAWNWLQHQLLCLSDTSFRVIADRSGHAIHEQQPQVIVEVVRLLIEEKDLIRRLSGVTRKYQCN